MKCPIDGETLVMTDREGVEIDYCPKCRGVWLDRGELDKIIERAAPAAPPSPEPAPQPSGPGSQQPHYYKKKKKKDFLSDLFDF
jgi:Zn-finger nucleic acid-binding protein